MPNRFAGIGFPAKYEFYVSLKKTIMTEEKKASLVMDYLDECDAATILSVLGCLVSNKDLADVYDSLHAEGIL